MPYSEWFFFVSSLILPHRVLLAETTWGIVEKLFELKIARFY
jgi:methyl coenzyme M reductase subunit D